MEKKEPLDSKRNIARQKVQNKVLDIIADKKQVGVEVSMRVGKCFIGLHDMDRRFTGNEKFIVAAPKLKIFDSWKSDAIKFGLGYLIPHIKFTTYNSLPKCDHDAESVYLDECHSLTFNHGDWLSVYQNMHEGRTVGLTGTYPASKKSQKYKMCNRFCPSVYTYTVDDAVEDGILNKYQIYVHLINMDNRVNIKKTSKKGKTWMTSEVKEYGYWTRTIEQALVGAERQKLSILRMKIMQGFKSKVYYARALMDKLDGTKTLVFLNTQKQADWFCEHSFHSSNPKSEKNLRLLIEDEISVLSAVSQLSEGVTIPGLKQSIITHSFSGASPQLRQRFGRLLGLSPDQESTLHLLCYAGSVDETWVKGALKPLNQDNIRWLDRRNWTPDY